MQYLMPKSWSISEMVQDNTHLLQTTNMILYSQLASLCC